MVDLGGNEKPRLLKRPSNLSQMLGEPPLEVTSQPHQARSRCSTPALEIPSTDHAHQHRQFSRFSSHSFMAAGMSPQALPSTRDADDRSDSTRPPPARPSQLDLPRFGLGRLRRTGSTRSPQSDKDSKRSDHTAVNSSVPSRSSSLRILNPVHHARPKDKSRRQSVQNPVTTPNGHPQKSSDPSIPRHTQRRSTSFWIRMRTIKDEPPHQQHSELDQDQENDVPGDGHPPLTEAQRIQSLRRRKKLAQLFGAEPPMALYRVASPLEGRTASANTIESERMKAYLALSSSDVLSISSDHSSVHLSQSDASIVSISIATPKPPTHDVDPSQESEDDPTQSVFRSDPNDDSSPGPHDPYRPWDDATATTFRRRRLRAAKLTQFFGVAYNDLSIPKVTPTSGHEADVEMAPPTEEVGVKIQERGRFWNRADGPNKAGGHDADMSDVIALLRQMPRA